MLTDPQPYSEPVTQSSGSFDVSKTLDKAINLAAANLKALQHPDGYWVFELEADCTISAEYIMMMHFMNEIDTEIQARIANYLRQQQSPDGSYALYSGGPGDLSGTVKAYYAMKMAGDSVDAAHMVRAKKWILAAGGASKTNVFTRILLAMFEQLPWRATPFMPVELMFLPEWFPITINKVSYWSRTVMVPLLILCSYRVKARNPGNFSISELFVTQPALETDYFGQIKGPLARGIMILDRLGCFLEPLIPGAVRCKATIKARDWFMLRLNGENGLGGIFTAMVYAYEAMDFLGFPVDHKQRLVAKAAINRLLVFKDDFAYCQPCVSPVWDTALVALTLQEIEGQPGKSSQDPILKSTLDWLARKQLHDEPGDWRNQHPHLEGGGWAFQFSNSYYPDVDDTAVAALALLQSEDPNYAVNIKRAGTWIAGMQSRNGGYGAFDSNNTHYYLNQIPFADHGALLDPPTADVSGRCLMFLGNRLDQHSEYQIVVNQCIAYLRDQQEADGSWFGRWGSNYLYGTWSVLAGYHAVGIARDDPDVVKAVVWLKSTQRLDGGWGESNDSYQHPEHSRDNLISTPFHTALAIMALLSAGETSSLEVRGGVRYLLLNQQSDGFWRNDYFNAPGFPRFFYLKYHGYSKFFPLWALGRYRNSIITSGNTSE